MSLREFLGHEFTETRTYATELGKVTTVTITREPRFDDSDREAFYALYQDDLERCPKCGNPRSLCSQFPEEGIFPQRSVCYVDAVREVAQRRFAEKHKDAPPDDAGLLPTDGVTIWASLQDLTPDDDFL